MRRLLPITLLLLLWPVLAGGITLREVVQSAGPANGYDRWVELETGVVYTGGLLIGPIFMPFSDKPNGPPGEDIRIVGNGAILDLQGGQICVSYCNNRLDIDDCVILNGGIRWRGYHPFALHPTGSARNITFYRPHDYALRARNAGPGIVLERNLIVDVVDTGRDFLIFSGMPSDWMPTGTGATFCITIAPPEARENWSWHSDRNLNIDPMTHFTFL
ncbi:MAG: hypothetical protein GY835_07935 [bacterium]|nr:hypothetical protein [bacterium]